MRDGISVWYSAKEQRWVFQVSYKDETGKRHRIQKRAKSKSEANRRALDLARSPHLKTMVTRNNKFDELMRDYASTMTHQVRPNSLAVSMHLLTLYVCPVFGKKKINEIKVPQVSELLNKLRTSGLSVNTVNTVRAKFHALMEFALAQGRIDLNPVSRVKPLKSKLGEDTQVKAPWSLGEVQNVLRAFSGHFLEVFLLFALTTGMRKGEILGLQWRDIDFENQQVRVEKSRGERRSLNPDQTISVSIDIGPTKTQSSNRHLSLTRRLTDHLVELRRSRELRGHSIGPEDFLVLGANGKPISPSYLSKAIANHLKAHNIRRIRIHDIRHTVAVLALEDGVPLEELSQGFGHSGVEITKRTYAPVVQGLSDRFIDRMDQILSK
jgi:integrase